MKKRNGFTLIELIAVITIIGLILIVAFPAVNKLISGNENKRFDK